MLNKVKRFFNRQRIINPDFRTNVQILLIEPDAEKTFATLGMSLERADFIYDTITDYCFANTDHFHVGEVLAKVSADLKHPNELAYASLVLGQITRDNLFERHERYHKYQLRKKMHVRG